MLLSGVHVGLLSVLLAVGLPSIASSALAARTPARAAGVRQQGERLDVGSFTVTIAGQRVGREQFSIRRITSQDGGVLELRAESATGEQRSAMRLETDSAGTPVRYSLEERRGAETVRRLGGQRLRGRFSTLSRGVTGEAAREYLLSPGALILEEDGLLQYALLVRGRTLAVNEGITIPTLTPTENRQGIVRLVLESQQDTVIIAGARCPAWRWRAVTSSADPRTIWADSEGRLLRVQLSARGIDALRDDVPR